MSKIKAASCNKFSQGETCNPGQTSVANSHKAKFVVDLYLHLTGTTCECRYYHTYTYKGAIQWGGGATE